MSSNIYGLTPLNLALDGSLDIFYDLYQDTYSMYLDKVKDRPALIYNSEMLDAVIIPGLISAFENLACTQLHIFTSQVEHVDLTIKHFKYFTFIDEEKVRQYTHKIEWERKFEVEFEQKYGYKSSLASNRHKGTHPSLEQFQETAISFEQFLVEFQRIVTRAIRAEIQRNYPHYSIFDARRDVEAHIYQRMVQNRNACTSAQNSEYPPNNEPLYVFHSLANTACKRKNHDISCKKYYVLKTDRKCTIALPVHFCSECNRYMIGRLSLSLFKEYCGKFIITTHMLTSEIDNTWGMIQESKLHKLGYNVIEGQWTVAERQNILISLLKEKHITFFEIVSTIELNIRTFSGQYKMQRAVQRWKDDLKFINEYMLNSNELE